MNLLAGTLYDPGTAVNKVTTAAIAMTAIDTTNLRLRFTVPASGRCFVKLGAVIHGATTFPSILLGVMDGATVKGRTAPRQFLGNTAVATALVAVYSEFLITGLTPGTDTNWDAAYGVETLVAATGLKYGGPNNTTANDAFGGFQFEIWDPSPGYTPAANGVPPTTTIHQKIDTETTAVNAIKTKTDFLPSATAGAAGGLFIAGTNAATTITTGLTTTFTGNLTGSVGSVTGAVGSVTGLTASDVGAIKTKTDFLPSATAGAAGGVFIAGTNAATTITTGLTTTFTGNLTGSVGSVTGAVGSVSGAVASVTGAVGSVTGNVGGNVAGSIGSLGATAKSDVNTEVDTAISDVGLTTTITGRIDAAVSSRMATYTQPTGFLAADFGNLDAAVSSRMATYTQPAGFLAATFPTDPADQSLVIAATDAILNRIGVNGAGLTALGDARLVNLDALVSSRMATFAYTAPPTATENADELLKRDMSAVTGEAARSPLNAFRALRNKTGIVGSTLTVTKEDDTTAAWTAALTTDAGALPVTGLDPA